MSASTAMRKPHRPLQKMTPPPVMRALRRAASRSRSRTPVRLPSLARFMASRSASSISLSFFSPASTPSPDQPLATTEIAQRLETARSPSRRIQDSVTPVAASLSPTPPVKYRRYRLNHRPAARWARKVVAWLTKNADRGITLKTVRCLADYLFSLADREILTPKRWLRVAVRYTDDLHQFVPSKDPAVAQGTTFRDYFNLKPGKQSMASAQAPALILQCALGARRSERACTRCMRELGGKGRFTECRQLKVKEEAWLRRGACLNCWRLGKHAQCSLARKTWAPAREFGPSKTRSGREYGK